MVSSARKERILRLPSICNQRMDLTFTLQEQSTTHLLYIIVNLSVRLDKSSHFRFFDHFTSNPVNIEHFTKEPFNRVHRTHFNKRIHFSPSNEFNFSSVISLELKNIFFVSY